MPRRRCVGCGRTAPKSELLRLAATAEGAPSEQDTRTRRAVADHRATMPGRGAYLCVGSDSQLPAAECLARAIQRGGIARALRSRVTVDPKLVESVKDLARPRRPGAAGQTRPLYFSLTP
ncbi:MAG: YlxR family protein [Solirubrobacteraceae bacterium]